MNTTPPAETSEARWQEPARQAQAAMLFIGLKYLRRALRQAWPLFLIVVVRGGQTDTFTRVLYLALAITGLQLITSIVAWFRFTFSIQNDELVVQQGLFSRKRSSIPLTRIQSLQFEQNVLHRRLGVVEVQVETAGSQGSELSMDALERERAEDLRRFIIARKANLQPAEADSDAEMDPQEATEATTEATPSPANDLLSLSPRAVLYAGLTSNHLRTAGLIVGGLFGLYQIAGDIFPLAQPDQLIERLVGVAPKQLWVSSLIMAVALAIAAVLGSLLRTGLRYHDLHLSTNAEGFRLTAGLFNRRDQQMRHEKLQYLQSSMNPLQEWVGLRTLLLVQVGGSRAARQSMQVPGCDEAAWERVRQRMFGADVDASLGWVGIHPRVARRYLFQLGLIPVLLAMAPLWLWIGPWALLSLPWIGVAYWLGLRYYRNFRYGLNEELLRVQSALFVRRDTQLWLHKVQAVHVNQTWIQRRFDLASVSLSMATGGVEIPYVSLSIAQQIRDTVLYRVETATEDWM